MLWPEGAQRHSCLAPDAVNICHPVSVAQIRWASAPLCPVEGLEGVPIAAETFFYVAATWSNPSERQTHRIEKAESRQLLLTHELWAELGGPPRLAPRHQHPAWRADVAGRNARPYA